MISSDIHPKRPQKLDCHCEFPDIYGRSLPPASARSSQEQRGRSTGTEKDFRYVMADKRNLDALPNQLQEQNIYYSFLQPSFFHPANKLFTVAQTLCSAIPPSPLLFSLSYFLSHRPILSCYSANNRKWGRDWPGPL